MREDKQEGQPGCTRFQSGVARLGLGGMSVALTDKVSESEIYKGAQTF